MNGVEIGAGIIGVVEFIKRVEAKYFPTLPQLSGEGTILLCVVLGAVAGYFGLAGLTVATGAAIGAAATGVHQVGTAAGGK